LDVNLDCRLNTRGRYTHTYCTYSTLVKLNRKGSVCVLAVVVATEPLFQKKNNNNNNVVGGFVLICQKQTI